jgi:hypothetical protein
VGAVDVQAPNVESGEQIADRIKAHAWLGGIAWSALSCHQRKG